MDVGKDGGDGADFGAWEGGAPGGSVEIFDEDLIHAIGEEVWVGVEERGFCAGHRGSALVGGNLIATVTGRNRTLTEGYGPKADIQGSRRGRIALSGLFC